MTDEEKKLARDLLALAIDHPWEARPQEVLTGAEVVEGIVVDIVDANGMYICTVRNDPGSAAFIAAAPELVATALDEVDRIEGQLTVVRTQRDAAQAEVAEHRLVADIKDAADLSPPPGWEIRLEARYAGERLIQAACRFRDRFPDHLPAGELLPVERAVVAAVDEYRKLRAAADETEKPS